MPAMADRRRSHALRRRRAHPLARDRGAGSGRTRGRGAALAAALLAAAVAPAFAEEPTASRRQELLYLLEQDCGSCHGLSRKGGLGPALLPEAIADRTDEELIATILAGSARRLPMPPWGHELDPEEAAWIVAELRRGPTPAP